MPFQITTECSGKDTLCQDICPFDCIKMVAAVPAAIRPLGHQKLRVDEELCTDCGACALVCEESAIVYDDAYEARRAHLTASDTWHDSPANAAAQRVPEGFVMVNGELHTWPRLMAETSD